MANAANQKNDIPSSLFVKLDRDNYPLWKYLALPIIRGCKLDGYMLGTKVCPAEYLTALDSSKIINPAFGEWVSHDQRLLGWLLNCMTTDIATQLLHCETSKQLWDEAQSLLDAHTKSQIIYLKSEFHGTRKGSMKMEEYLTKMNKLSDKLKLAGNPISMSDLTIQTLNGDADYNLIVVKLSNQDSLTWVDLQAQLLAFESRLEQLNNITNLTLNASANVVNKAEYKGNKFNTNSCRGSNLEAQEEAKAEVEITSQPVKSATKLVTQPWFAITDYDWYFDSGASNHVAHHTDKFQDLTEHNGKNSLMVGNRAKLEIIGKVLLRGKLKYGLYQLSESSPQSKDLCAYISIKESWHRKLGHPNNKVLDRVLKSCNIKTPSSDQINHLL
ncbi:glutamate receptor [Trifolium pratense]|uniref:Glutamate receptor n=1 Tax=Trifolium pratense TaxID=57577 RepID=A0A2K3NB23_TRIPR|nr:glutamate receptor [Trifolium pratense]